MKEIIINDKEAGQRLDKFIFKYLNNASGGFVYKMLRRKNIVLNDKKAGGSEKLETGDSIKMYLSDYTIAKFSDRNQDNIDRVSKKYIQDKIVYEDENIIFINKPAGVLSQKSKADDISINEMLISYLFSDSETAWEQIIGFKPSVCHRLDRNTSGIITACKNMKAQQEISEIFKLRTIEKYYLCIVKGRLDKAERIEGFIAKNKRKNKVTVNSKGSTDADLIVTEYNPLKKSEKYTLLEVKLITGKTHQIRAHLASIGYPVIGDYKYGDKKTNDYFKNNYGVKYQMLHSYRLTFPKMTDKKLSYLSEREFVADMPDLFCEVIKGEF